MMAMNLVRLFAQYERELVSEHSRPLLPPRSAEASEWDGPSRIGFGGSANRAEIGKPAQPTTLSQPALTAEKVLSPLGKPTWQPSTVRAHLRQRHRCSADGGVGVMAATIRKRVTGKLDKFGNPVVSIKFGGASLCAMSSARQPATSSRRPRRSPPSVRPRHICAQVEKLGTSQRHRSLQRQG